MILRIILELPVQVHTKFTTGTSTVDYQIIYNSRCSDTGWYLMTAKLFIIVDVLILVLDVKLVDTGQWQPISTSTGTTSWYEYLGTGTSLTLEID